MDKLHEILYLVLMTSLNSKEAIKISLDYFKRNDKTKSIIFIYICLYIDPKKSSAWAFLGSMYVSLKDYAKAKFCYEKAFQYDPDNGKYLSDIGFVYGEVGNSAKHIEYCQRAIKISSNDDFCWNNLGYAYGLYGEYKQEEFCFKRCIEINPRNSAYWNNLAFTYGHHLHDYHESINCYIQAIAVSNEESDLVGIWTNMGATYSLMQEYSKAMYALKKAISIEPKFPNAHRHLGMTYFKLNNIDAALSEYEKAIELNSDYHEAIEERNQISNHLR